MSHFIPIVSTAGQIHALGSFLRERPAVASLLGGADGVAQSFKPFAPSAGPGADPDAAALSIFLAGLFKQMVGAGVPFIRALSAPSDGESTGTTPAQAVAFFRLLGLLATRASDGSDDTQTRLFLDIAGLVEPLAGSEDGVADPALALSALSSLLSLVHESNVSLKVNLFTRVLACLTAHLEQLSTIAKALVEPLEAQLTELATATERGQGESRLAAVPAADLVAFYATSARFASALGVEKLSVTAALSGLRAAEKASLMDDAMRALARETARRAVILPTVWQVTELLECPGILALAKAGKEDAFLLALLRAVESRSYATLTSTLAGDKSADAHLKALGVDRAALERKLRHLTLATAGYEALHSATSSAELTYDAVAKLLAVKSDVEVERCVIEASTADVVAVRLNQEARTVTITSALPPRFDPTAWQSLATQLAQLQDIVLSVHDKATAAAVAE
jgi:hypothetical protein